MKTYKFRATRIERETFINAQKHPKIINTSSCQRLRWIKEHLNCEWGINGVNIEFYNEEDAVAFKLRWGE